MLSQERYGSSSITGFLNERVPDADVERPWRRGVEFVSAVLLINDNYCCETLPSRRHTEGVTADRRDRTVCWASDAEIPIGRLRAGSPVLWPCAAA